MTSNEVIKVGVRIRPAISRERRVLWKVTGTKFKSTNKLHEIKMDNIFKEKSTTQEVFDGIAKPVVSAAMMGINGTIFAYGQTSSGKTYTMMGNEANPGIIPLSVHEIFQQLDSLKDREYSIRIGYIEIYNEKIFDLLDDAKPECQRIFENSSTGEILVDQQEILITNESECLELYNRGCGLRRIGTTNMNDDSSRSHTIFRIKVELLEVCSDGDSKRALQIANLNLVDLAGSERVDSASVKMRLSESRHINKSLLALGNVIRILSDENGGASYINYRDSKLTRILSASLGGNSITAIICTITLASLDETFSTLQFAQNAKKIKNKPKVNKVMAEKITIAKLENENATLKNQLELEKFNHNALQDEHKGCVNNNSQNIQHLNSESLNSSIPCARAEVCAEIIPNILNSPEAGQLNVSNENFEKLLIESNEENARLKKINETLEKKLEDGSKSPTTVMRETEFKRIEKELKQMNQLCQLQHSKIKRFEEVIEAFEKNGIEAFEKKTDDVKTIQKKYDIARQQCNSRNSEIAQLIVEVDQLTKRNKSLDEKNIKLLTRLNKLIEESEKIHIKYGMLKKVCEIRQQKIDELNRQPTSGA